jgi:hypothetical protein
VLKIRGEGEIIMALIKKGHMQPISKERIRLHETTEATYTTFMEGDSKIFQIDTYGSEGRVIKDKVSQSIQLDRESALELIGLLLKEFVLE